MTEKEQEIQAKNRIRRIIEQRWEADFEYKHKRYEEQVRQPYLRLQRRIRGIPEPKITVEQAIEITRDYFVNVEGRSEDIRELPLLVTSTLLAYEIRPLRMGASFVSVKVDMADGSIYDVVAPEIMM